MFSPHWRTHLAPVSIGSDTAEAAAMYLISAGVTSEASPLAVGGLISIIESVTGDGNEQHFAH